MAKLNCPKCPDFDGFAMCTSQPLSKVASYEWCRKYLEGLEEVNGTITLSTDLFLRLLRKAYSDAYYGAIHMEFMRDIKDVEYPLEIHIDDTPNQRNQVYQVMIKKLIIRSSVLLLFGIIESILAVQNMELVEFCKTTALIVLIFLIVIFFIEA